MKTRRLIPLTDWDVIRIRMRERRMMVAASLVLGLGLCLVFWAKTRSFEEVRLLLAEKEMINLSAIEHRGALVPVFEEIYADPLDQKLAAEVVFTHIFQQRSRHIRPWTVRNVGQLNTAAFSVPARKAEGGGATFRARLVQSRQQLGMDPEGNPLPVDTVAVPAIPPTGPYRISGCVWAEEGHPLQGVTVFMHGGRAAQTQTDATGCYAFEGLAKDDSVVVQPVRKYHAFSAWHLNAIGGERRHDFQARAHRLPLLETVSQLRVLKPKLVVRSPWEFTWLFWGLALVYFGALYSVHAFWFRRRFSGDPLLLPILHLLTGLAFLLMFSLQDPLRDIMRASGFVLGLCVGCVALGLTSQLDFQRSIWRRRPSLWLGVSALTAVVLFFFGTGPTGSAAKVNLTLPWVGSLQPVELIKLSLVLFLAGYFARNWSFLRELHQQEGLPRFLKHLDMPRFRDLWPVMVGIGAALVTFYVLRDMGPALVIGCTFLVLYGIVRNRWMAVGAGFLTLVTGCWVAYRSQAVPMVAGRIEMLLSPWDNFVVGGEHLAHAYWAMATGGTLGRGLGAGNPSYIPAAHTDMVLPALGEEIGLLGLVVVFTLYAALLYRALTISLRAGGVFSLFLGLSITLITLFQIVLIAGGAFGLVPLSGVVTPFISFGKSSMIINCILVGVLMSISARPGSVVQDEAQQRQFRRPVQYLMGAVVLIISGLVLKALYVQALRANEWSIKPALMVRGSGERAYIYNPRILDARQHLIRGTIFDRNGIPLATSQWDELEAAQAVYEDLGADLEAIDRTDQRYYPFGPLAFYLLGDVRTRVKWGAANSLFAEHAYLSHLRGYDNYPVPVEKQRSRVGEAEPIVRYDYAELLPLLRYGPEDQASRALLARDRTLRLTIDVRLQARVAQVLKEQVAEGKVASVVVLDAARGDVLASVTYPLPEAAFTDPSAAHRDQTLFDRGFGRGAKPPGSTLKLVTAIAALNKMPRATQWRHTVRASDRYARRGEPTGTVDMGRAVIASSNVYFAALAHDVVGADSMLQALELFGFGVGDPSLTPSEKVALLRAPDNLRQAGFGQGPVTGSPLQVALVAATIANSGLRPEVRWVYDSKAAAQPGAYVLVPHHAQALAGFMRRVVTGREGTAKSLRALSVPVAGKTGTAEEVQYVERNGRRVRITVNHAWFTGFAPYQEPGQGAPTPQIAIAVLVEEGGSGGRVAAPIAGAVIEAAVDLGLIAAPQARSNESSTAD